MPTPIPSQPFEIAPDLAIEIISPGNKPQDTQLKIRQLLDAGTEHESGSFMPDLRSVNVHTSDGATTLIGERHLDRWRSFTRLRDPRC